MRLAGIELAPFVGAHNLASVDDRHAHEGARCREVAAYACMNVPNQLPTLEYGDAPLHNP
jgi:hypothetical protein